MLANGFVWDDNIQILSNTPIMHGQSIYYFTHYWGGYYRPIMFLLFTVIYSLAHGTPQLFHIIQLILHTLNCVLLYLFLEKISKSKGVALILSLIFAIHPINQETVAYIADLQDVLFVMFGLAALLITTNKKLTLIRLFCVSIFLLLSVLSKETGALFILILPMYRFFIAKDKRGTIKLIFYGIVVALFYFILRISAGGSLFYQNDFWPIDHLTLVQRTLMMPTMFFYYVKQLFFPLNIATEQLWLVTEFTFSNYVLPLVFTLISIGMFIVGYRWIKRKNNDSSSTYLFFCLWFLLGILFHLQIFPLEMTVADRWFYFPFIGLLGLVATLIAEVESYVTFNKIKPIIIGTLILVMIGLATRTLIRNLDWKNSVTLFSHDVQYSRNFDIENNLGSALSEAQDLPEAVTHFLNSVALFPYGDNLRNLGSAYLNLGQPQKALLYFRKAYHAQSYIPRPHLRNQDTYLELAWAEYFYGSVASARSVSIEGLHDYPQTYGLLLALAVSEYKLGNRDAALSSAQNAYALNPNEQSQYVVQQILHSAPLKVSVQTGQ